MDVPELQFVVEQEEGGGYSAYCNLPGHGIFTQAASLEELRTNLAEVTQLYLASLADEQGAAAPQAARIAMHFVEPVGRAA
jgi:predicted RNase H-like HicB family nuclease